MKRKYRLIKIIREDKFIKYSIERKIPFFNIWKELDHQYTEDAAIKTFNIFTVKPKIEILKEVTV